MADSTVTARPGSALRRAIPALGLTQLIAWGTTYYLPAVLRHRFSVELALSDAMIFAGVGVTLVVAALVAWPVGRLMDSQGAGRFMPVGSLCLALGLLILGNSTGWMGYFLAWVVFGFGMSLAMANAAFSALTQMAGQGARRAIVIIMLFGGLAATVFWPLTLWLDGQIGWRNICFLYAALHLLVCLPLHVIFLAGSTNMAERQDLRQDEAAGLIPPQQRRQAAALIGIALAGNGFVSWGLDLHLITIFTDFGLPTAVAVWVAAMKGPATLLARGADILSASRLSPMTSALAAGILIPVGLSLALVFGEGLPAALLFIVLFSFGTGLMTVARATLALVLLGSQGYATTLGRMTLPTQIVYAVSPMLFSLMIERLGTSGVIVVALAASVLSLAALILLARLAKGRAG
jgi:MFS family permease